MACEGNVGDDCFCHPLFLCEAPFLADIKKKNLKRFENDKFLPENDRLQQENLWFSKILFSLSWFRSPPFIRMIFSNRVYQENYLIVLGS
jgi:hypothetical protein